MKTNATSPVGVHNAAHAVLYKEILETLSHDSFWQAERMLRRPLHLISTVHEVVSKCTKWFKMTHMLIITRFIIF